ncbi:MAG: hypothetical protein ABEJ08_00605 [Halobacteriaceae archaeon]
MSTEPRDAPGSEVQPEVMASVDEEADGDRLVIADVSRDDAWLSMEHGVAPALDEWR